LGSRVHRLNARIEGKYVALDHYKAMGDIDRDISKQVKNSDLTETIESIARKLVANLFFFEPSARYRDSNTPLHKQNDRIPGTIRCRLAQGSASLKGLVDIIDSFWYTEIRAEEGVEGYEEASWAKIPLPDHQFKRIRTQRDWLRVECSIIPVEKLGTQEVIAVTLKGRRGGENKVPISGFPVEWHVLQQRARRH
jgi:hypothetical protein